MWEGGASLVTREPSAAGRCSSLEARKNSLMIILHSSFLKTQWATLLQWKEVGCGHWGLNSVAPEYSHQRILYPPTQHTFSSLCNMCRCSPCSTRRGLLSPEHKSAANSPGWRPKKWHLFQLVVECRVSLRFPSSCREFVNIGLSTDYSSALLFYVINDVFGLPHGDGVIWQRWAAT